MYAACVRKNGYDLAGPKYQNLPRWAAGRPGLGRRSENLIGRRDRRTAYAVATALVAAAFAFPALAAAEATEEGAVVESFAPSHQGPYAHWTWARLDEAEPLPVVTLPGPEATPPAETEVAITAANPEAASTAALRSAATARTAGVEGVEVATAESTVFPNSANGKLFGTFEVHVGPHEYEIEDYVCSGSVIKSPHGDVVLTAGHCVIDPETGTVTSSEMVFIPGYRNGTAPYGIWRAEFFTTTETWKKTAKAGSTANEGGDLAFVDLKDNGEGESVEEVVGSLGINFDQACNQVYTQFGYPAEAPYNGEILYSHTASYAGPDTNSAFSPVPMKIASDFTRGSSGGPWAIGVGIAPTVQSLTAYGYENQPGFLYGPYFGEAARKAYGAAFGQVLPAGIEETCAALPVIIPPVESTPTPPATTPPPSESTPLSPVSLKVTRVRRRANGSAVLTAKVSTAGMLMLSGSAVRAESVDTPAAGQYRLVVAPKGPTTQRLRQQGRAKVGISVAFSASGKTQRVSRSIQLSRRLAGRAAPQPAQRSG
jgi:hypothetical protein